MSPVPVVLQSLLYGSIGLAGLVFGQAPLPAYNVDSAQVSVAGFSSGAFMAQQLSVAYSSRFMGVGVFAGYHYDCRRTQPQAACYGATIPDISGSRLNMDAWSGTLIDPVANIARQRIYVFSGVYDADVPQTVVNQAVNLLELYAPAANVRYDNTLPVGHVFPTDIDGGFDGAGVSLQWIYGPLKPRNTGASTGNLFMVDQGAYAPRGIGMDEVAWLYVPAGCARGESCRLHVFLHGCGTSYEQMGVPIWADYSGHRQWADTNDIILLFPQVLPDAAHPEGCWDSNAWYGSDYDQKSGAQMTAIMGMVSRITSGHVLSTTSNYQGLWWNAAESGWGINFAHQGDQVFATWYTYDTTGKAWWLTMLAARTTPTGNAYTGTINASSGPPFNNYTGTAGATAVGSGMLTFADANTGSFAYTVNGVTQTKAITRFDLATGPQATCSYSATTPNFAAATNYQDLWWKASEPGWGLNLAQQGNSIFATWYTYNADHTPLWLSALVQRQGTSNVYTGPLSQSSGARFDAFNPAQASATQVGTATLTFTDGAHATFGYSVMVAPFPGPVTQSKSITRFLFAPNGGTLCQ